MFPEKAKRGQKKRRIFALLLLLPMLIAFRQVELGILGDSIAMMVMICAAIYLVYQLIAWLIGKGFYRQDAKTTEEQRLV